MIFNEEAFFDNKLIKTIIELIITLDKVVDLIKVQPALNFEDIQLKEDKIPIDGIENPRIIDGFKNDIEYNKFLNKLLNESFYLILLPLIYFIYLNYKDVSIFI